MATKQAPKMHGKLAETGTGPVAQTPGKAQGGQPGKTGVGPSNHVPKTG